MNNNIPDNIITIKQTKSTKHIAWDYQFIPLDDSSEDAVFSNISKIIARNNLIFILDGQGRKLVYVYDNLGKYIKTIGRVGQGPSEYINARDFNVKGNNIYIYDDRAKKLLIYNYTDNVFKYAIDTKFYARAFSLLDNGNILFVLPKDQKHHQIVITDKNANILKEYIDFKANDKDNRTRYNLLQENNKQKIIVYNKPQSNTVYFISKKNGALIDSCRLKIKGIDNDKVYFKTTPIVKAKSIMGNYVYNKQFNYYCVEDFNDKEKRTSYVDKIDFSQIDLSKPLMPMCLSDNGTTIISYITLRVWENATNKRIVDSACVKHLKKGGFVLCKYKK